MGRKLRNPIATTTRRRAGGNGSGTWHPFKGFHAGPIDTPGTLPRGAGLLPVSIRHAKSRAGQQLATWRRAGVKPWHQPTGWPQAWGHMGQKLGAHARPGACGTRSKACTWRRAARWFRGAKTRGPVSIRAPAHGLASGLGGTRGTWGAGLGAHVHPVSLLVSIRHGRSRAGHRRSRCGRGAGGAGGAGAHVLRCTPARSAHQVKGFHAGPVDTPGTLPRGAGLLPVSIRHARSRAGLRHGGTKGTGWRCFLPNDRGLNACPDPGT